MLFDFDDILIEPEIHTNSGDKKLTEVFDEKKMIPLFSFSSDETHKVINDKGIYSITNNIDNNISLDYKNWISYKPQNFEDIFIKNNINIPLGSSAFCLIEINNINISDVKELLENSKKIYGRRLTIMIGNCLNPMTYLSLSQSGADYVRIGDGDLDTNSTETGVGYPMASLIHETSKIQQERNLSSRIVADFRFKTYSEIIKSLALGADYIMIREIFNREDSVWTENFVDLLKSAMNYTDCKTLGEFTGRVRFNLITENSLKRYKK